MNHKKERGSKMKKNRVKQKEVEKDKFFLTKCKDEKRKRERRK